MSDNKMPLEYWLYTDKEGFIQVRHEHNIAVLESESGTKPLCLVPKSEYIRADKSVPISELEGLMKKYKKREEHILMDMDVLNCEYYEDELGAVRTIIKDLQNLIDKGRSK